MVCQDKDWNYLNDPTSLRFTIPDPLQWECYPVTPDLSFLYKRYKVIFLVEFYKNITKVFIQQSEIQQGLTRIQTNHKLTAKKSGKTWISKWWLVSSYLIGLKCARIFPGPIKMRCEQLFHMLLPEAALDNSSACTIVLSESIFSFLPLPDCFFLSESS